jgi:glutathione S-transferase
MYTLYYLPGACSLATQVILHELKQPVKLIDRQQVNDFEQVNPVGTVPVLIDGDRTLSEGAAVMMYLLDKHGSRCFPRDDIAARQQAIQDIMFANATMHPAYGRLFFIARTEGSVETKQPFFDAAAQAINALWDVVEERLQDRPYLGGDYSSAADIMLAVYSRWGAGFPVSIKLGEKTAAMVESVIASPSFQRALQAEVKQSAA